MISKEIFMFVIHVVILDEGVLALKPISGFGRKMGQTGLKIGQFGRWTTDSLEHYLTKCRPCWTDKNNLLLSTGTNQKSVTEELLFTAVPVDHYY